MMVITPATARWVRESVTWLWDSGVVRVRANLSLRDDWDEHRAVLLRELVGVGHDLLARRLELRRRVRDVTADVAERLPVVEFEPFAPRCGGGASPPSCAARRQVVVGTSGNLYPCAPMVGEDRDGGAEAALRLGHVSEGAAAILPRCDDGCADGGACACAAFLETGDPRTGGENGLWYAAVCREIGAAVTAGLAASAPRPIHIAAPEPRRTHRRAFVGALLGAGGLALVGGGSLVALRLTRAPAPTEECARLARAPPGEVPAIKGEMAAPPAPPAPVDVDGDLAAPPQPEVLQPPGGLAAPPSPLPLTKTAGVLRRPTRR